MVQNVVGGYIASEPDGFVYGAGAGEKKTYAQEIRCPQVHMGKDGS